MAEQGFIFGDRTKPPAGIASSREMALIKGVLEAMRYWL